MEYYIINNVKYATNIPKEWATNHLPGTGPHECELCSSEKEENIWVNYCWFCAKHHYHGSRDLKPVIKTNKPKETKDMKQMKQIIEELTEEDWAAINLAYEMRNNEEKEENVEVKYEYGSDFNGGYDSY